MANQQASGFSIAARRPEKWTVGDVQHHLQTACHFELATIPLYLCAAYSIISDSQEGNNLYQLSKYEILKITKQEMLHLALAGNILRALGSQPELYNKGVIPTYPIKIFREGIKINLRMGDQKQIKKFARLEAPAPSSRKTTLSAFAQHAEELSKYHSIGEFYEETMKGLEFVSNHEGPGLFKDTATYQFRKEDGSWPDTDMKPIVDFPSAKAAMKLIIEQGEGFASSSGASESHFSIFTQISKSGGMPCYPVAKNLKTEGYKDDPIYIVMQASDAAYCYLLLTIETCWKRTGPARQRLITNNMANLMRYTITEIAEFLVKQKLAGVFDPEGHAMHAGPPFNYYEFSSKSEPKEQLMLLIEGAIDRYQDNCDVKKLHRARDKIKDLVPVSLSSSDKRDEHD